MSKRRQRKRPGGRGSVFLIVLLLVGSATIRVATGAGEAIAKGSEETHEPMLEDTSGHQSDGTQQHPVASQVAEGAQAPALDRTKTSSLLKALSQREERVAMLEKQVEMRAKALAVADEEIQKRLQSLENAEKALRATLALAQSAAEDDLAKLTAVYENMKPKDAAAVFEAMEPDFAAGFLGRMRPDAAAAVMAGLKPEKAYSISVILAGRNANVPKT